VFWFCGSKIGFFLSTHPNLHFGGSISSLLRFVESFFKKAGIPKTKYEMLEKE
jgi:hypothetical protein